MQKAYTCLKSTRLLAHAQNIVCQYIIVLAQIHINMFLKMMCALRKAVVAQDFEHTLAAKGMLQHLEDSNKTQ